MVPATSASPRSSSPPPGVSHRATREARHHRQVGPRGWALPFRIPFPFATSPCPSPPHLVFRLRRLRRRRCLGLGVLLQRHYCCRHVLCRVVLWQRDRERRRLRCEGRPCLGEGRPHGNGNTMRVSHARKQGCASSARRRQHRISSRNGDGLPAHVAPLFGKQVVQFVLRLLPGSWI